MAPSMWGQLPVEPAWSLCHSPEVFGNSWVAQTAGFAITVMALQRPLNPLHKSPMGFMGKLRNLAQIL